MPDHKILLRPNMDNVPNQDALREENALVGDECYEIKVEGCLDASWSEWLGGLKFTPDSKGNTRLIGVIPDQAALHGLLVKIRDLGLPILSLQRLKNYNN